MAVISIESTRACLFSRGHAPIFNAITKHLAFHRGNDTDNHVTRIRLHAQRARLLPVDLPVEVIMKRCIQAIMKRCIQESSSCTVLLHCLART